MLGSKSREVRAGAPIDDSSMDVAKLLFDTFSRRVAAVEESVREVHSELGKMKSSSERSQISDLVLLERIQRTEGLLEASLGWTKRLIELIESERKSRGAARDDGATGLEVGALGSPVPVQSVSVRPIVSPSGEAGSLSSITTPTELQVLSLLAERGPISAPEIGRLVGRSREHTARLMKQLYQEGYVKRDQNRIPFRYSLAERVRQSFSKPSNEAEQKPRVEQETQEETVVPPPQS